LRLHVGGKTGVGQRGDVHRLQAAAAGNFSDGPLRSTFTPASRSLSKHSVQMVGARAVDGHFAIGGRGSDGKGGRFDAVGNDFVFRAVEAWDARDGDGGAARAGNARAHGIEEIGPSQ
jgi:hypothetical protein